MDKDSDISTKNWTRHLPAAVRPYAELARLDRPIGWWLLLLPSWWAILSIGIFYKTPLSQIITLMVLFLIGAMVMRGAGCVINDLWDRDLDRKVARTRNRALASGAISPMGGVIFLIALLAIGLLVLIQLPPPAIWWAVISLPLIVIYPLAKRIIDLPQFVLGLTFAWGIWVGSATIAGYWPHPAGIVLYVATALWIFGYDTIYAIQDTDDDKRAGIKSSALTLGRHLKPVVALCYGLMVLGLILAGALRDAQWIYYIGIAGVAIHLNRQISRIPNDIDKMEAKTAGELFRSNRNTGLILTLALMVEILITL